MQLRIGTGIDFHKLEINKERPLLLGGHLIESEFALVGHSDADILIHAISDAILGALGLADIGQYFPDTDKDLKNMNSIIILNKADFLMKEKKFRIENIDSTIIGEKPRIAPHREKIILSLSKILDLESDRISVKATTTEKMGALGRSEGLAAISTVLLIQE